MKIVITGGTGLVGRELTKQLQAEGHEGNRQVKKQFFYYYCEKNFFFNTPTLKSRPHGKVNLG